MRSTFWACVVGLCLACGLSGLGCGDDEPAAPGDAAGGDGAGEGGGDGAGEGGGDGAGEGGGDGVGEASCSGFDPSTVVDDLTPAEAEQACRGYRRCSYESLTVELMCHMMGVLGAKFGDDPGTTDAELQARCAEQYESCMADPSQAEDLIELTIAEMEAQPCVRPTQCTATIAELDACFSVMRERAGSTLPECSELTLASYDGPALEADDALVAACGAITADCWQLVSVRVE
ncbi:hypothetical protein [Sorangium sp. So ce1024]|uniref:hypothetical protein n=1 Tax=unclassified Sorangium TaxID=2621164 RepID=UPI003F012598